MLWISIAVLGITIDLVTSNFIFIWFGIGAIAAILGIIFKVTFVVQVIIFLVVSTISLGVGYPVLRKSLKKSVVKTPTMEENYIGKEIIIEKDVNGRTIIKYQGIYWTVKNVGEPIVKGDKVKILGTEGNIILIQKTSC